MKNNDNERPVPGHWGQEASAPPPQPPRGHQPGHWSDQHWDNPEHEEML